MKRFAAILLIACTILGLFPMGAAAASKDREEIKEYRYVESVYPREMDYSFIRSSKSSVDDNALCTVKNGEIVYVEYIDRNTKNPEKSWAYVTYKNYKGYMWAMNLSDEEPAVTPTPTPKPQEQVKSLTKAKVGDLVSFGKYEQDGSNKDGREQIIWQVLEKKSGKLLLVSQQVLECKPYHENWGSITWEGSSLRKWLNDTFYEKTFSSKEQKMIEATRVSAEFNPVSGANPGNDTKDKVFILSYSEVEDYVGIKKFKNVTPTAYAESKGAGGTKPTKWWVRNPGSTKDSALVYGTTEGMTVGEAVNSKNIGVRPAIWVKVTTATPTPTPTPKVTPAPVYTDLAVAQKGDIVRFGKYEQDDRSSTGEEDLEWLVLDRKLDNLTLISLKGVDCQPYYGVSHGAVTWEDSDLRTWLNEEFYYDAFDPVERTRILWTTVRADVNPKYKKVDPGNNVMDRVYILSAAEAEEYFKNKKDRKAGATVYAIARNAYSKDSGCWWWLRTPGDSQSKAACVKYTGEIVYVGNWVGQKDNNLTVRPVIHVRAR